MVTINKANIVANIWETVKDAITSGVTTVTLADATTQTIQTYTSSFPDKVADTKTSYPIIVINPVDLNWTDLTFTRKRANGTFEIEVYATKSEAADLFLDKIIDTIETNRDDLRSLGVSFTNLDSTRTDEVFRGQIKVHIRTARFTFKFTFDKTRTW
jgi:hypothetical protein